MSDNRNLLVVLSEADRSGGLTFLSTTEPRVLVEGLVFPEAPRWRDDKLWFVDMFGHRVMTVDLDGTSTLIAEFDDLTSGLGFLPDGTPLVVLMEGRRIMRLEPGGGTSVHADLSSIPALNLNDMVVNSDGRAYVDCIKGRPSDPTVDVGDCIVLVEANGEFRIAAEGGLHRPNGLAITADGKTLIAAELTMHRLTAFDIEGDGSLNRRRRFADVPNDLPDGICLDTEGAAWLGSARSNRFVRVRPGGVVTDTITVADGMWASACALGGSDRRTLFMTAATVPPNPRGGLKGNLHESLGAIMTAPVSVAGAGRP